MASMCMVVLTSLRRHTCSSCLSAAACEAPQARCGDWLLQGWQSERVLYRDGPSGCVLLVLPTDPAAHLKKVWRAVLTLPPRCLSWLRSLASTAVVTLAHATRQLSLRYGSRGSQWQAWLEEGVP